MYDERQRLRDSPHLALLLAHYAQAADRDAWQDRLMRLDGVEAKELSKLHGELIAFGWVEQNTGVVPGPRSGACPGCYRATPAGRRMVAQGPAQAEAA